MKGTTSVQRRIVDQKNAPMWVSHWTVQLGTKETHAPENLDVFVMTAIWETKPEFVFPLKSVVSILEILLLTPLSQLMKLSVSIQNKKLPIPSILQILFEIRKQ